jgi:dTDP-4-dehydrorhamnose 3,5-epimerase
MGWQVRRGRALHQGALMRFVTTPLAGAYLIEPEQFEDERGFFARTFCADEFVKHGLNPKLVQCNISYNKLRGTLRGMHYQKTPYEEAKLVRCTQGGIYDVIIDLRCDSVTRNQWFGVELNAENHKALYVPEGFAHGFITLYDATEVLYQMSQIFRGECAVGVRWNDPGIDIKWPIAVTTISDKDRSFMDVVP